MIGTREVQPIGQVKPRLFMPVTIRISPAAAFERFHRPAERPAACCARSPTRSCASCAELSGQEYVNRYAKRKDAVEAGAVDRSRRRRRSVGGQRVGGVWPTPMARSAG